MILVRGKTGEGRELGARESRSLYLFASMLRLQTCIAYGKRSSERTQTTRRRRRRRKLRPRRTGNDGPLRLLGVEVGSSRKAQRQVSIPNGQTRAGDLGMRVATTMVLHAHRLTPPKRCRRQRQRRLCILRGRRNGDCKSANSRPPLLARLLLVERSNSHEAFRLTMLRAYNSTCWECQAWVLVYFERWLQTLRLLVGLPNSGDPPFGI